MTFNEIMAKVNALKAMRTLNEIIGDKDMDNIIHNKLDELALQLAHIAVEEFEEPRLGKK
jgi:hypothetical protein